MTLTTERDPREQVVLVVDDDRIMLPVLELCITEMGYSCKTAASYEAAIRVLATCPIHLAILDVVLVGGDTRGLEILDYIRAKGLRTRVILISACWSTTTVLHALKAGALDVVEKSMKFPAELRELVHGALNS